MWNCWLERISNIEEESRAIKKNFMFFDLAMQRMKKSEAVVKFEDIGTNNLWCIFQVVKA